MKVTLTTSRITNTYPQNQKQSNVSKPLQKQENSTELTNFNTLGRSLVSFKGQTNVQDALDLESKSIAELEDLKQFYQANQEEIDKRKKEAQERLDKIAAWDYWKEYEKQKIDAEDEITRKGLSRFWNPFKCSEIKEKHYLTFTEKDRAIDKLKERKAIDEEIINSTPLNDTQAKMVVGLIDNQIKLKKADEEKEVRLNGLKGVQDAIDAMSNAKGGLNDRIAGYEYEKAEIRRVFTGALAESKKNPEIEVPAAIMLHGASGTGKTTIIRAIGREAFTAGQAKVVELTSNIKGDKFLPEIRNELDKAKERYFEEDENGKPKRTRTVLLINEVESFLGMTLEQAKKTYGNLIDEVDEERIAECKHDFETIREFKSLLDSCAMIPESSNDKSDHSATTIFITTNYPHLIDRDILRKIDHIIAVNPAKNKNLESVIRHYFEKSSKVIEEIKKAASNPDFRAKDLRYLKDRLSQESIDIIIKMVEEGTINKLDIPYENMPYDKMAKDYNPTPSKGAFDNKQIKDIGDLALNQYIQNPDRPYYGHFYSLLYNEPRKIDSARYQHFIDIYNTLAPLNKREGDNMKILAAREKDLLLKMANTGIIGDSDRKRLDYILANEAEELRYLESREKENTVTEAEKMRLEELRKPNFEPDIDDEEDE